VTLLRFDVVNATQIITIEEAAEYLGISDDLAYKLANTGQFPGNAAITLDRQWRVSLPKLFRAIHGYPSPRGPDIPQPEAIR
jgi:excisionase family DNA binding protein